MKEVLKELTLKVEFTETQKRILTKLSDGMPHHLDDIVRDCWENGSGDRKNLKSQKWEINRKFALMNSHEGIICEYSRRKTFYRWVRFISKYAT